MLIKSSIELTPFSKAITFCAPLNNHASVGEKQLTLNKSSISSVLIKPPAIDGRTEGIVRERQRTHGQYKLKVLGGKDAVEE